MFMIVYMYADASILLCVGVGRCMRARVQVRNQCVLQLLIPYFWKRGFSLNIELTDSSRRAGP